MELSEWIIEYGPSVALAIGALFGVIVLIFVGIAVAALAGTKALTYVKLLWAEVQSQSKRIIEAVDEPTDKLPIEIATTVPGAWDTPEMWSALLTGFLNVILAQKKEAEITIEAVPQAEVK